MIVVDSSVWLSFFNGRPQRHANLLERILNEGEDIAVHRLILTEVLMGFRQDRDFRRARDVLLQIPLLPDGSSTYLHAAALYRRLRQGGTTIRGAVDC